MTMLECRKAEEIKVHVPGISQADFTLVIRASMWFFIISVSQPPRNTTLLMTASVSSQTLLQLFLEVFLWWTGSEIKQGKNLILCKCGALKSCETILMIM